MSLKYCPRCDRNLECSLFGLSRSRRDGYQVYCRECTNKYMKERREACRDQVLAYRRKYAKQHKQEVSESHRKWRNSHREQYNAYQRAWRASKKGSSVSIESILARLHPGEDDNG